MLKNKSIDFSEMNIGIDENLNTKDIKFLKSIIHQSLISHWSIGL